MKFNKKTAAFALTTVMAMGSIGMPVIASDVDTAEEVMVADVMDDTDETPEHVGDIIYDHIYFNKETQMVTGYYDDGTNRDIDLVIPSRINGVPVLGIADGAFLDCWDIKSAVIEEGVQTIGDESFKRCEFMKSIVIPSTVTRIGFKAFYEDGALRNVYFARNSKLTTIDAFAFAYCDLGLIKIPASVTTIESCAFGGCDLMYACIFEGNAPENMSDSAFSGDYCDLTIYYYEGSKGFEDWTDCKVLKAPEVWNFSDAIFNSLGTITSNVTIDNMTILADAQNTVQVKENSRTLNGMKYDYCLSLKGKGNTDYRAVKIDVSGDCKINIAAASNTNSRELVIAKKDGTVVGTVPAGVELSMNSVEYIGDADSLYIYSEKDNVNIYEINVDYNTELDI